MLLAADIGNSQVKLGWFAGARLHARRTLPTDAGLSADEWAVRLRDCAGDLRADAAAVCSSVPAATTAFVGAIRRAFGVAKPLLLGEDTDFGMAVRCDPPAAVGRDRLADALATRTLYGTPGAPCIALDFGTATTLNVVDARGDFVGGAIAPGLSAAARALLDKAGAPHLPPVELRAPERAIGASSVAALQSGIVLGHAAMADGLVRRMTAELGAERHHIRVKVVATGGWSALVAPLCATVDATDPDLTLNGIRLVWERNRG